MTNVIDFPQQAQVTVDKIETHIETARAELGDAGFASTVGRAPSASSPWTWSSSTSTQPARC